MHSFLRAIPVLFFSLLCAYVGCKLLGWLRSVEKKLPDTERFNSIRYTLMFAFLYWVAGIGTSFIVGFLPEALLSRYYVNTGIEPFAPAIATTGLAFGIAFGGRGAGWTWIFGLLWLAIGVYDIRSGWNPAWSIQRSSWAYAMVNLFGPTSSCSSSECLGELFFTTPFTASLAYSIGAVIRRFALRRPTISVSTPG